MSERLPRIITRGGGTWVSFHGISSHIMARGEETLDTYTASRGTAAPGSGAPPHSHTFDEGFFVLRGEMTFHAGNTSVYLKQGDFINIRGGVGHYPKNDSDSPAELLTICAPAGFDRFQLAFGEVASGPEGPFSASPPGVLENAGAVASEFGIELNPAPELFQREPQITVRRAGEGRRIAVAGDVYTFLATAGDTGGRYAIWHAVVHPGGGPPPHIHHKEEEAFYILRGELTISAGGGTHVARAGDWVMAPRGSEHSFKNRTDSPLEILILVAPAGLERLFEITGVPWQDPWQAPPPTGPEEIARLLAAAAEFGIELRPPHHP